MCVRGTNSRLPATRNTNIDTMAMTASAKSTTLLAEAQYLQAGQSHTHTLTHVRRTRTQVSGRTNEAASLLLQKGKLLLCALCGLP